MKTTFTAWIYPKTFIDATRDPDPYLDAIKEARGAQRQ
jgi:hypothetical protein